MGYAAPTGYTSDVALHAADSLVGAAAPVAVAPIAAAIVSATSALECCYF